MTSEVKPERDRNQPLTRIPDDLLTAVLNLLKSYATRGNPSPTAEDISAGMGQPVDVIKRACRKLEITGQVIVSQGDLDSQRTYSVPVEETSGAVPEELLKAVMDLIYAYEERGNPPPTVPDMAAGLGASKRDIRWACSTLEVDGLVRTASTTQGDNPGYLPVEENSPDHAPVADSGLEDALIEDDRLEDPAGEDSVPEVEPAEKSLADLTPEQINVRNKVVSAVLRSTALVFKSKVDVDIQVSENEVREDLVTTEDISVFLRVTGEIEGSVYFGFDRSVALGLLEAARQDPSEGINARSIKIFNDLVTHVGGQARHELSKIGYDVDVSPAASVQKVGMRVTTHGYPQVVTTLDTWSGPIEAHVSLQEPVVEEDEDENRLERLAA